MRLGTALGEAATRKALLAGVCRGRARPATAPGFPGALQHMGGERPRFPGMWDTPLTPEAAKALLSALPLDTIPKISLKFSRRLPIRQKQKGCRKAIYLCSLKSPKSTRCFARTTKAGSLLLDSLLRR